MHAVIAAREASYLKEGVLTERDLREGHLKPNFPNSKIEGLRCTLRRLPGNNAQTTTARGS